MERLTNHGEAGAENKMLRFVRDAVTLNSVSKALLHKFYNTVYDRLAAYEDAEEQGQFVRLPCKVGDTVYTNITFVGHYMRKKDRPYRCKVVFVGLNETGGFINIEYKPGVMYRFDFSDFRKTVFLTREEALRKEPQNDSH